MTKLKSASRFGPRYGTPLKQTVRDIEEVQKKPQECPKCSRQALLRRGFARWECRKCGAVVAGGAFTPRTELGRLVERIVRKGEKPEQIQKTEAATGKPETREHPTVETREA